MCDRYLGGRVQRRDVMHSIPGPHTGSVLLAEMPMYVWYEP